MAESNLVARHYDELLAAHYSWMVGTALSDKVAEQQNLLAGLGVGVGASGIAVDLGSGPGYQSIALAKLGYEKVLSIDTSRPLLDELEATKGDLPIQTIEADLLAFKQFVEQGKVSVIVCMGDTLTHLNSRSDVSTLFADIFDALAPNGQLILTFRDFSTPIYGLERIIPVRSDEDRIMTCLLDYGPTHVVVTDLVHVRENRTWKLHKSSYEKLRISPADIIIELQAIGFVVDYNQPAGRMHALSAHKPD